jgi:hypothetical protein
LRYKAVKKTDPKKKKKKKKEDFAANIGGNIVAPQVAKVPFSRANF